MSRPSSIVVLLALLASTALLTGCGGGSSSTPAGPTPTTTLAPAPTPTPTPEPTPDPNPTLELPAGPVTSYEVKLWKINRGDDSYEVQASDADEEGQFWVRTDDFIVFDSTQKNATGNPCQVESYPPTWHIDDPSGALELRGSSNEFLLRADVVAFGVVRISVTVDGITSNEVAIWARAP